MTAPAPKTGLPRPMILAGALLAGLLFALAVHMIGQRYGLDLGALWTASGPDVVPFRAALAWWITASGAFGGGYAAASLMIGAASGELPPVLRYVLVGLGVLALAGAGQAAAVPGGGSASGVIAGLMAMLLGATMAFCGAQLALRRL